VLTSVFQQLELDAFIQLAADGTQRLTIKLGDAVIGTAQQIAPKLAKAYDVRMPVMQAEFNAEALAAKYAARPPKKYKPVPRFPGIEFDLAFVVDQNVAAASIEHVIRRFGGNLVTQVSVFDVFLGSSIGEGKKSIAFRINFLDSAKTLTLNDIQPIIDQIVKEAGKSTGAVLRA
jgi:phenylalanyl-tRNA synthetase beta chain